MNVIILNDNESNLYICPCCGNKTHVIYDGLKEEEAYMGKCECGQDFYVSCYKIDDYGLKLTDEEFDAFDEHEFIQNCINEDYENNIKKQVAK